MIENLEEKLEQINKLKEEITELETMTRILKRDVLFELGQIHKEIDILCNKSGVDITPEDLTNYDSQI